MSVMEGGGVGLDRVKESEGLEALTIKELNHI